MKKYFLTWLIAMALIVVPSSAFATTAAITGKFASYPAGLNYFPVRVGEKVNVIGNCSVKDGLLEELLRVDWTIDGVYTKSKVHPAIGRKSKSFVVAGPANRDFSVKIQCMTGGVWYQNDAASRQFKVMPDLPPAITADGGNPLYASGNITIKVHAASTGDGVKEVYIQWPGAPSTSEQMTYVSGDLYQYTIATGKLPEDPVWVQIWANSDHGANKGWENIRGFTVDRTEPSVVWDSANAAYTNGNIAIKANISDAASGVKDAWITWTGGSSMKMDKNSGTQYSYVIPARTDGVKKVLITATDRAGNTTGWVEQGSFTVDTTPPEINWLTPLDQDSLSGDSVRITGNLTEENPDYVTIEWQAENETAWQSYIVQLSASKDFEYELSGLTQDLNYRIRMYAVDKTGNRSALTPIRKLIGQFPAEVLFESSSFSIIEKSLVDKDQSGGLSQGDDAIYALALETGNNTATSVSLRYALPAGLAMTPGTRPYFTEGSDIRDGSKLNANWNGGSDAQLLADDVDLNANGKLLLHIPVTIAGLPATSPLVSIILAGAQNARDELTLTHSLALQDKFPAHRALDLELASLQPNWKYAQGTVFDYRITAHVRDWALSGFALNYALPPGLEKHGEAHLEETGASVLTLNPTWGKNGVKLLLSASPDAMLPALHSFAVIVPVKVAETADSVLQSEVEARASNLSGPVSAVHRIVLDGSGRDPEEQLTLKKTVDKQTARPGQTQRYTITYANVGVDDLHDLVIRDAIQDEYLTLQNAQCGPIMPKTIQCRAVALEHGKLEWHLDGKLEAGDFGSVGYEALVNKD